MNTSQVDAPTSEVRRSRRRSELTTGRLAGVAAIAAVSAVVGIVTTDAAPTGWAPADALYIAAFVAITVAAASRARRWSLLIAPAVVSVGLDGPVLAVGLLALAIALVLAWRNRRNRIVGALVGGLVAVAALHLSWPDTTSGATSVLAALAVVPLWVSGYRVASSRARRRIVRGGIGVAAVLAVGVVSGAVVALTQRGPLLEAADRTSASATALTEGAATDEASDGFEESRDDFTAVVAATDSWWAAPARITPVVAQNLTAVRTVAEAGADLTGAAAELTGAVDYDALRLPDGRIDLAALASFSAPVTDAADAVESADARVASLDAPWIVGPVRTRLDDLSSQLVGVRSSTALAAAAVEDLPALLGADGPRRYLLLLGNPAEARDLGGHLGNWAELVADDGRLDVVRVGAPYDLFGPATEPRPTLAAEDLPPALVSMDPTRFPQNWGSSPDLATVAELAADLYPQAAGGAPLDGVLYADPFALAALLSVTGPVTTSNGTQLSEADAVEFLTRGQFVDGDGGAADAAVTEVVELALDQLTTRQLPSPSTLAERFGPVIAQGRLQFHSLHPEDGNLLTLAGLDRPIERPDGGDLLAVVNRNSNPSKIDSYLRRTVDYRVDWDPATGAVRSRVTVTMANDVPAGGVGSEVTLPPPGAPVGTNRTQLSIVTPFRATGALLGDADLAIGSTAETSSLRRHSVMVDLPPGERRTVTFDLSGEVAPGDEYHLRWIDQPLVLDTDDRLLIRSTGTPLAGDVSDGMVRLGDERVTDIVVSTVDATA